MTDQEFVHSFKLSEETTRILERNLDASVEELRKLPLYAGYRANGILKS